MDREPARITARERGIEERWRDIARRSKHPRHDASRRRTARRFIVFTTLFTSGLERETHMDNPVTIA